MTTETMDTESPATADNVVNPPNGKEPISNEDEPLQQPLPSQDQQMKEDQSVENQLVEDQPVKNQPVEDQLMKDQSVEDHLGKDQSMKEPSLEDQPMKDQPVDNQLPQDQPVDNQPSQDQSMNNQPSEDQPMHNQPTEDHQTQNQPSQDQSSLNQQQENAVTQRIPPRRTTIPTQRMLLAKEYQPRSYNGLNFPDYRNDKEEGLDLYAWQVRANAQPLHKSLQTARKVLLSRDWMVSKSILGKRRKAMLIGI